MNGTQEVADPPRQAPPFSIGVRINLIDYFRRFTSLVSPGARADACGVPSRFDTLEHFACVRVSGLKPDVGSPPEGGHYV